MAKWRTLLRVVVISLTGVGVVIPSWDGGRETVWLAEFQIPADILSEIEIGYRFHAKVNLGAETAQELEFSDFERN